MDTNSILITQQEFRDIDFSLDERRIRLWCAAKARVYNREHGKGGVNMVSYATGVSRRRIHAGLKEIESPNRLEKERIRRGGGGRKKIIEKYPDILEALDNLVDPESRGDPKSPLRWTAKSTYSLAEELQNKGYSVRHLEKNKALYGFQGLF